MKLNINIRLLTCTLMLLCGVPINILAQGDRIVHGTVHDLDGNLVSGTVFCSATVSVVARGTFTIQPLNFPDTIRITALGFVPVTRIIHGPGNIFVRMTPSVEEIKEVIVNTGYQAVSPNEINGSVALITSDMITSRSTGNILERIQGHATGLTTLVGKQESRNGTGVLVRGLGTLHGPIEPLIVLDGFIYEGDIDNIDPNAVENVTILKDAAAASIWGARAGNGVIVITTKKGRFNQRMRVSLHADHTIQGLPRLNEEYRVGAETHIAVERFLVDNGYFDNVRPYAALSPVVDLLLGHRQGKVSQTELDEKLSFWAKQDARQNYLDEFYTHSQHRNYGLQINGGSDWNSYMLGASYYEGKGSVHQKSRRINIRLNNQFRIMEKLTLSTNLQLSQSRHLLGRPLYGSINPGGRTVDYLAFRDDSGKPLPIDQGFRGSFTDSIGEGILLDWKYYPTEEYKHRESYTDRLNLFSTFNIHYKAFEWLELVADYQYQIQNTEQVQHHNVLHYDSRNLINQYTQYNPNTGVTTHIVPLGGLYDTNDANLHSFSYRGQANINHRSGPHRLSGILGAEFRGSGTRSKAQPRLYGYQENPLAHSVIDVITRYPHYITGAMTAIGPGSRLLTRKDYRFVSYYGNMAYTYLNRYTVTGSARRDGSNLFGVNTNDRWKPLWSAGIGWNISNEPFYDERYVSDLKMILTYGRSGNVDMTRTALPIAGVARDFETNFVIARIESLNNPELKWEQLDQLSIRIEGSNKSKKISGSVSFFKKTGSDLYGDAPFDFTGWGVSSTVVRNVAAMEGHGVEVDLKAIYLEKNQFRWQGSWFLNWNENKTTKYHIANDNHVLSRLMVEGNRINPVVGQPLYAIAAYKWAGLDEKGDPRGYLGGVPSTNYIAIRQEASQEGTNILYIGSATPRYYGSVLNTFNYRSYSLTIGLNFQLGYFVKKDYLRSASVITSGIHREYLDRWQKAGDELITDIPAFNYPADNNRDQFYGYSELQVIPGDHVRLNYIKLAYSFNTTQWRHPFRSIQLNAGMENGTLLWKKNNAGLDPHSLDGSRAAAIWSIGLNAQF